jgi:hypothetical protein
MKCCELPYNYDRKMLVRAFCLKGELASIGEILRTSEWFYRNGTHPLYILVASKMFKSKS